VRELKPLLRLAFPLIAAQVGGQLMSFVDTAMVGRLGSTALAGVGIGNGIFFAVTLIGMGLVMGMEAPTAQAWGARDPVRARRLLWNGVHLALLVSVPLSLIVALAPWILTLFAVEPGIARTARDYMWGRVPNVLPFLLFTAARSYLQAVGATRPIVLATVFGNVANVIGNGLLIWGDGALRRVGLPAIGLPALGPLGSAISSSIACALMAAVLFVAVARFEAPADAQRRRFDRGLASTMVRLGLPFGLQILAEVGVFTLVAILTGRLGAETASGHQVAITLASFSFTITIGVASATSVLVGHAIGRGDTPAARRAGFAGFLASWGVMATSLLAFLLVPQLLARILTNQADVIAAALPLIRIAAFFQLSDGTQATAAGALRGAGDARFPLWANLVGHYAVGLPVALALGLGAGMGAAGFWWGLSAGLTAVGVSLLVRFAWLTRTAIARV
jgi:MATE family multidrug resistance protein